MQIIQIEFFLYANYFVASYKKQLVWRSISLPFPKIVALAARSWQMLPIQLSRMLISKYQ